jgi:uncharacterized protein (TIGR02421 family)
LVAAQRPIRVLDAIKWDDEVERDFFAHGGARQPQVSAEYYRLRPLPFDARAKVGELRALEREIAAELGQDDDLAAIMRRRCHEYRDVVEMLAARGTAAFIELSARLYGRSSDRLHCAGPSIAELGLRLEVQLQQPPGKPQPRRVERRFGASEAARLLASRLARYFRTRSPVRVQLADAIIADAAAGSDYIKLRRDASFTARDIRQLEVHEGWVHLATTLNGQAQPFCTFLSKGPPSSTVTQEGLGVVAEFLASACHPVRVRRLADRVRGIVLAEGGGTFLDVYRHFMERGVGRCESYQQTARIFRGSLPEGLGPFSKDLSYTKGYFLIRDFLSEAVEQQQAAMIPLLFCGKTAVGEMSILARLVQAGLIARPAFVPPSFADGAASLAGAYSDIPRACRANSG